MVGAPAEDVGLVGGDDVADAEDGKERGHREDLPLAGAQTAAGRKEGVGEVELEELHGRDKGVEHVDVGRPAVRRRLVRDVHRVRLAHRDHLVQPAELVLRLDLLHNDLRHRVDAQHALRLLVRRARHRPEQHHNAPQRRDVVVHNPPLLDPRPVRPQHLLPARQRNVIQETP